MKIWQFKTIFGRDTVNYFKDILMNVCLICISMCHLWQILLDHMTSTQREQKHVTMTKNSQFGAKNEILLCLF